MFSSSLSSYIRFIIYLITAIKTCCDSLWSIVVCLKWTHCFKILQYISRGEAAPVTTVNWKHAVQEWKARQE